MNLFYIYLIHHNLLPHLKMKGVQDVLKMHEYYVSIKGRSTCHNTAWTCTADGPEQTEIL